MKKVYRSLAWFFSTIVAAGTLAGCGGFGAKTKYGAPAPKYGPPSSYNKVIRGSESSNKRIMPEKVQFIKDKDETV